MNYKILLTLFICALAMTQSVSAQVYVNQTAAGANDGTSWANAYTNLQSAFDNATPGDQIWVAAGTYLPTITTNSNDAFYRFNVDIELYGGFDGTETQLADRDVENNLTILSGDHAGDDVDGDFNNNKDDNSLHVMFLTDTISTTTIIDGLIFEHGYATDTASTDLRRGGGLLTYGAPTVRNCIFQENYGFFGGGLYPRIGGADGIAISDCIFRNNSSGSGGGIYINCPNGSITNCTFLNNSADNLGGGLYNNMRVSALITDCMFDGNLANTSRGGGLYCTNSPAQVSNCTFDRNRAPDSSGGGLQVRTDDDNPVTVTVMNCTFNRNNSTFGGAVGAYDPSATTHIMDCTFTENSSANVGGAISNAFGSNLIVERTTFMENSSGTGGAIYSQNDSARTRVVESMFLENQAELGAAINITGDNEPGTTLPVPTLQVETSFFQSNVALNQGGCINMSNGDLRLTNSVLSFNDVLDNESFGGALSLNTSDSIVGEFILINNTIANNTANNGAGISHWEELPTVTSTLIMQNNILQNPIAQNYFIENAMPEFVSNGGNLSSDGTLDGLFIAENDTNAVAAGFVDSYFDYNLLDDSPAVNTGIDNEAPTTDYLGNPRVGRTDKGAYENQVVVGVADRYTSEFGSLDIYPNPVVDHINYTIDNDWKGEVELQIYNGKGQIVQAAQTDKSTSQIEGRLEVGGLPTGVYQLTATNGAKETTRLFIKR